MKKIITTFLILIILIPASWSLFGPGYSNMHDDLQVMRIFEMEKCFSDGQIPCRWAPDMAWGYGQAMFNFYSAFPYYLGVFIRMLIPLSIMGTVRALFFISLAASAVGMYLLASKLWGRLSGIFAATLYVYAPYHALDIYIRGALSESFALAILPFLWHSLYLLVEKSNFRRFLYVSLCIFTLLTTHNISTMIYALPTALWVAFWVISEKKWGRIKDLIAAGLAGFGLAAFFILPVLFEKKLIQVEFLTMNYLNYIAHFVTIKQLFFDRSWGHGPSIWGPNDDISFQIGWPHWWLIIPAGAMTLYYLFKRKNRKLGALLFGMLGLTGMLMFLSHCRSTFIWQAIPTMSFVQFPWRFLGPVMFTLSLVVSVIARPKIPLRKLWFFILIILVVLLNFQYFKAWKRSYEVRDEQKLSGLAWDLQRKSAILDYLPYTAPDAPKEAAPDNPWLIAGDGFASNYSARSNSFFFDVEVYSDEAEVQIPVTDFPNWVVVSGGAVIPSYPSGKYGAIAIKLPEGKHIIQGRFENTPIRSVGNALTLISASTLFVGVILVHNKKKFLWY